VLRWKKGAVFKAIRREKWVFLSISFAGRQRLAPDLSLHLLYAVVDCFFDLLESVLREQLLCPEIHVI
jgi:hypothetical protein